MYSDGEKAQDPSRRLPPASARNESHQPHRPNGVQAASSRKSRKNGVFHSFFRLFFPCISSSKALDFDPGEKKQPNSTHTPQTPASKLRLPQKHRPSSAESPANARFRQTQTNKQQQAQTPTIPPLDKKKNAAPTLSQAKIPPSVLQAHSAPNPTNNSNISETTRLDPIDTSVAAGFVPVLPPQTQPPTPSETTIIVPPTPVSHLLPDDETCGMTSGAVQAPGSTGDESRRTIASSTAPSSEVEESVVADESGSDSDRGQSGGQANQFVMDVDEIAVDEEEEEARLIRQGGSGIPIGPDGRPCPLLPEVSPAHKGRKCLVLDMDETLLHGSFKLISQADFVIPVEIDFQWHNIYVVKRPGVEEFLRKMGEIYEVIVFTASVSKYADAVLDKLDIHRAISHRLFRESCYIHKGNYIKDLSRLGRPIDQTIILDNSPASYIFNPNNAVPVSSWFNDPHDTELTDMISFLSDLRHADDVRGILDGTAWTP